MTLTLTEAPIARDVDIIAPRPVEQVVVLADCDTTFEREEIERWADRTHPGAAVLEAGTPAVDLLPDEAVVVPARVVWLPPFRQRKDGASWSDVVELTRPRRPRAGAQRRFARRFPQRVLVVAGASDTVAHLRSRHAHGDDTSAFNAFVRRQAVLACEAAERDVIGDRYKVPRLVVEQVSASAQFHEKVRNLAAELGRPEDEVLAEAKDRLAAMVTVQSRLVTDLYARISRVFHERAWTVSADAETMAGLKELNKSSALVFLPSHKTYLDPAVLAEVLAANDFPRNRTLGGDNMSFWPFGTIGRRAGLIFIRRKFGNDRVYRLAARAYLSFLVSKRFNLEWYLEGGRSRTGKLRSPMLGLLAYLVDALDDAPEHDVMIVPTSIVYDQLAEIQTMAAEDAGGTKQAESLGWVLRYAKAQRSDLGAARVRFGEPFSLRAALEHAGADNRIEKVAFQVMDGINRATPITATSLAGYALLGAEPRAYSRVEIERILDPLLAYIAARGLPGPDVSNCRGAGLERTLDLLTDKGVLAAYDGGAEKVWAVTPQNRSVAAYYRNGAVHHFVNRAITELMLIGLAGTGEFGPDERRQAGLEDALRLRDLLKFEFYFPDKEQFTTELVNEMELIAPHWRELGAVPNAAVDLLRGERLLLARRTLQPFLDAQLVVAEQLVALGDQPFEQSAFLSRALAVGKQQVLQGRIGTDDSVSRELYTNALKLAANRGLLDSDPDALQRRADLLAEIHDVRARLATIEETETTR